MSGSMANPDPLVSIILPVCNGEPHISGTLESALSQTYRNTEVIVVDDGSRDGTRAVVEARALRDSRVRVIGQTNRGVAAARNRALAAARGDFIAPLDADDVWDPTKLERQVRRMIAGGEHTGLVYSWWMWIDVNGAILDCSPRWRIEGDTAQLLLQVNFTGSASVPLYRRKYLEEVGGYDVTLRARDAQGCEDWDVALKVAERCDVGVVPSMLVGYRRRRGSMSAQSDRMWRSHRLMMDSVRRRCPELCPRLLRRSEDQFALHLAGVSFWSGAYWKAIGWGLQAVRSSLAAQILPYVVRLFARVVLRPDRHNDSTVLPGLPFPTWNVPQPLIPYDLIYARRFERARKR
jgi:glycosyltransferase involved in cell wall biosynthesis